MKSYLPIGHQFVQYDMVFNIKMEDFRQKARFVAGGHMTEAPTTIPYASVVSKEVVMIISYQFQLGQEATRQA